VGRTHWQRAFQLFSQPEGARLRAVAVRGNPLFSVEVEPMLAIVTQKILLRLRGRLSDMVRRHYVRIGISETVISQQA
jgi:hypothetical protein